MNLVRGSPPATNATALPHLRPSPDHIGQPPRLRSRGECHQRRSQPPSQAVRRRGAHLRLRLRRSRPRHRCPLPRLKLRRQPSSHRRRPGNRPRRSIPPLSPVISSRPTDPVRRVRRRRPTRAFSAARARRTSPNRQQFCLASRWTLPVNRRRTIPAWATSSDHRPGRILRCPMMLGRRSPWSRAQPRQPSRSPMPSVGQGNPSAAPATSVTKAQKPSGPRSAALRSLVGARLCR